MKTVDIAMATYNGENFLEEQILSIQKQSYQNWNLYISDDGSTDSTVKLIQRFASEDSRIKLINTERKGGVIANFNCALEHTVSEYIALCDQDDIWPSERLEKMVCNIKLKEENGINRPIMFFSDLVLVDEKGFEISESFYKFNNLNPYLNMKKNRLCWNCTIYGCTTIINRSLLNISIPIPSTALMHDQWLALKASHSGGLYYLDGFKSIRYRQHSNNVVGGRKHNFFSKFLNIYKNLKSIKNSVRSIKLNLKGNNGLYTEKNPLINYFDFCVFAFKEIFPEIFNGEKKIHSFFLFIGFILIV